MAIGLTARSSGSAGTLLYCLPFALLQLTGCANSHGMDLPAGSIGTTGSAGASAPTLGNAAGGVAPLPSEPDASVPAAGSASIGGRPAPQSVTTPTPPGPVDCSADRFPALAPECPATLPAQFDTTCTLPDGVACRYLSSDFVVELRCEGEQRSSSWSVSNAPCRHDCSAARSRATPIATIDTAGCDQRPLAACEPGVTEQAQVDAMLLSVLGDPASFELSLFEDTLVVDFQNGCPTELHTKFNRSLEAAGPLVDILSRVRWSCALQLSCGELRGPSTIAAL